MCFRHIRGKLQRGFERFDGLALSTEFAQRAACVDARGHQCRLQAQGLLVTGYRRIAIAGDAKRVAKIVV